MKMSRYISLVVLFLMVGITYAEAQPGARRRNPPPPRVRKAEKIHARRVIRRTAFVIHAAHKAVKENKVYTGNLARAVAHQRFARKLYVRGRFLRAMHQSRLARRYAILALQANKGAETAEMRFDKEDEEIMNSETVSDKELQDELDKEMPGYSTKDEDFMDKEIGDIDLGDND
jgi:hypothetical protein